MTRRLTVSPGALQLDFINGQLVAWIDGPGYALVSLVTHANGCELRRVLDRHLWFDHPTLAELEAESVPAPNSDAPA